MVEEYKFGQMGVITKEIGNKTNLMEKEEKLKNV